MTFLRYLPTIAMFPFGHEAFKDCCTCGERAMRVEPAVCGERAFKTIGVKQVVIAVRKKAVRFYSNVVR